MARIDLVGVAHSYSPSPKGDDDYALKPLTHVWEDGGAYALLGPSGCGKTTLLNIVSGLLHPSQGQILINGKDVTNLAPEARNIAQVFQFPVVYDTMSVFDNLAFPLRNRRVDEGEIRPRVEEIADALDLTKVLQRRARGLDADVKQKISLGRGLVRSDVAAILFDEPLTVIDPYLKWQLRRKLKEIQERFRLTLVYVTHDQIEALTFADKVVVMYDGRVVQLGTPQELFEMPQHTFVGYFIGSPGMNVLPCRVENNALTVGSAIAATAPHLVTAAKAAQGRLMLGIRPEFVQLAPAGTSPLVADILNIQDLGQCRMATLNLNGQTIKARLAEHQPVPTDAKVGVVLPEAWVRLYADDHLIAPEASRS